MKIMDRAKQSSTTAVLTAVMLVILINVSVTYSIPLRRRSVGDQMSMSDAMLRDFMMFTADFDNDGKLSESEITWFYRNVARYDDYVAELYGSGFIEIADYDNDGLLNPEAENLFPINIWKTLKHRDVKLSGQVGYYQNINPFDFEGSGSKVKIVENAACFRCPSLDEEAVKRFYI